MGFKNSAVATVWKIKDSDGENRFRDVQISTSRRNKKTGEYESDFSGYVRFVANAVAGVEDLKEKDRIILKNVDVSRRYDKKKRKEFVNFTVFGWERATNTDNNEEDQYTSTETTTIEDEQRGIITREPEDSDEPPFR